MLDRLDDLPTRVWYAQRSAEEGWRPGAVKLVLEQMELLAPHYAHR